MVADDASNGCGDANWSDLGEVSFIFVETEKVGIGEVGFHGGV